MPDKVIPIADDVFGNEICFDFRKNHSNPSLVFGIMKLHLKTQRVL